MRLSPSARLPAFLPVWLLSVLGELKFASTTFSDTDFGVVGIILGKISQTGQLTITVLVIGIVAALVAYNYLVPAKPAAKADNKPAA